MGLAKDLRNLTREYRQNPKGQYFRHLQKILDIHKQSGVSKKEIVKYVEAWGNKK